MLNNFKIPALLSFVSVIFALSCSDNSVNLDAYFNSSSSSGGGGLLSSSSIDVLSSSSGEILSSSSGEGELSSSSESGDISSSSEDGNPSSSSEGGNPLSSSSSEVPSSSSSSSSFSLGATTGNLSFTNLDYAADSIFFIGTAPTISNTLAVGNATCVLDTTISGTATLAAGKFTAAGTYSVAINVTCGTDYSGNLKTINATVAPNPTLNGTCAWTSNVTNAYVGGTTAVFKNAAPTISNNYNRCGSVYVSKDGGKTIWNLAVPAYNNVDVPANTITNINYYSKCGSDTISLPIPCPNIKVRKEACAIETENKLATFCPGISLDGVKLGTEGTLTNTGNAYSACVFFTDIAVLQAGLENGGYTDRTKMLVNGTNMNLGTEINVCASYATSCTTFLAGIPKIDGGYYFSINAPQGAWFNITGTENSTLTCRD